MSPDIVLDLDADSNTTGYYVGYMPEFPGAHSQGLTIEELRANLVEVVTMLREDPDPPKQVEFIGTQQIVVA